MQAGSKGAERRAWRFLTALLTDHGNFKDHIVKMKIEEFDICRLCLKEPEPAEQIV